MTDHKYTDEDVIKGLECCVEAEYCATCPSTDFCKGMDSLMENALSLIKRQKIKIEGLESNLKFVRGTNRRLIENESVIRTEAIKEFAERFKKIDVETFAEYDKWGLTYVSEEQIHNAINSLVKEMTEEQK